MDASDTARKVDMLSAKVRSLQDAKTELETKSIQQAAALAEMMARVETLEAEVAGRSGGHSANSRTLRNNQGPQAPEAVSNDLPENFLGDFYEMKRVVAALAKAQPRVRHVTDTVEDLERRVQAMEHDPQGGMKAFRRPAFQPKDEPPVVPPVVPMFEPLAAPAPAEVAEAPARKEEPPAVPPVVPVLDTPAAPTPAQVAEVAPLPYDGMEFRAKLSGPPKVLRPLEVATPSRTHNAERTPFPSAGVPWMVEGADAGDCNESHPDDPEARRITVDILNELIRNLGLDPAAKQRLLTDQFRKCARHPDAQRWYENWLKDHKEWYLKETSL